MTSFADVCPEPVLVQQQAQQEGATLATQVGLPVNAFKSNDLFICKVQMTPHSLVHVGLFADANAELDLFLSLPSTLPPVCPV